MDFGRIFSRAWRICWDNKYLFVLGFLAALGSSSGNSAPQFNYSFTGDEVPPGFFRNLERIAEIAVPIILGLLCLAFLVGLILWLIRLASQAGLISAAARINAGQEISFGQAFSAGTGYLPRFVGLNLLVYLPFWIIGLILAGVGIAFFVPAFSSTVTGQAPNVEGLAVGGALLAVCVVGLAICLLIPLWAVLTVIYAFAQRALVVGNLGLMDGLRQGWRVVRENVGDVILLVILLVVLSFLFGLLVGAILVPLGFLAAGPTVINLITGGAVDAGDVLVLIGSGFLLGIISAILNSILVTYRSVTVTLAYQEMIEKGKAPA